MKYKANIITINRIIKIAFVRYEELPNQAIRAINKFGIFIMNNSKVFNWLIFDDVALGDELISLGVSAFEKLLIASAVWCADEVSIHKTKYDYFLVRF